jgi:hypothetical protein
MRSVGSHSTSEMEKEGKKENTEYDPVYVLIPANPSIVNHK